MEPGFCKRKEMHGEGLHCTAGMGKVEKKGRQEATLGENQQHLLADEHGGPQMAGWL